MWIQTTGEDTVKVYGKTPDEAYDNAMRFRQEFIGERWKRIEKSQMGIINSNGREFFCTIIFRSRWRRVRDSELSPRKHFNQNNVSFARTLRNFKRDEVLIDKVVLRNSRSNEEKILGLNCYVVGVILFHDDSPGDEIIRFNVNKDASKTDQTNVECSVRDIDYVFITYNIFNK